MQKTNTLHKLIFTAIMAGLAFVLSTFVYFPAMAPFQHFINVICAVLLGPWYGFLEALICASLRMASGRTIQALVGAIFGPICGGLLYRKTKNVWAALLGEVFGVGILGALAAYPLMRAFYGLEKTHFYHFIPFYIPSALVGGFMGVVVILSLKKAGVLSNMQRKLS